jgi:hypothetical protein
MQPLLPNRPPPARASSRSKRIARVAAAAASLAVLAAAAPAQAAPLLEGGPEAGGAGRSAEYPPVRTDARGGRCTPSIEASSTQILAGESVSVSGTLLCAGGAEPQGQTVSLLAHTPRGADGFAEVASASAEGDGSYRIDTPALDENTILFVRVERAHSARVRVSVAPRVTVLAPASGALLSPPGRRGGAAGTNSVTFSGTVTPAAAFELVVLQGELPAGSGRWRRIGVAQLDESGGYAITHTFKRPGEVTVRVLVRSSGALALAASQPLMYTIAARQRPRRAGHAGRAHIPRR